MFSIINIAAKDIVPHWNFLMGYYVYRLLWQNMI